MVDLEKVIFDSSVNKKSKKEVQKDLLNFELISAELNEGVDMRVIQPYDNDLFVLNCGQIINFKFPEGSKDNKVENDCPPDVKISFNYNNKEYEICGHF